MVGAPEVQVTPQSKEVENSNGEVRGRRWQMTWVQIPARPLTCCVNLAQLLTFFNFSFLTC